MNIPPKYEDLVFQLNDLNKREAKLREELSVLEHWRDLALQFDNHRMKALWHLKTLVSDGAHYDAARNFLSEPPIQASALQQRLTVAERRESEAREELLDLSRKLDVFYSRSHGIKNLSAIEDANDKSKALQQRLTVADRDARRYRYLREGAVMHYMSAEGSESKDAYLTITGYGHDDSAASIDNAIDAQMLAALKPAAEPERPIIHNDPTPNYKLGPIIDAMRD